MPTTTSASPPRPEGSGVGALKLPGATDDHIGMRDLEERTPPEDVAIDNPLAFAVFALTHAACGDVMEVRIGERCILG